MARQYDLETQSWIGEDDPPADPDGLREDILRFWSKSMKDDELPLSTRRGIARDAAPYLLPKLSAVANVSENDLAERLMRALQATNKVINARPMQVIEPPKIDAGLPEPLPDHSGPFAQNSKHRWRRF